MRTRNFTYLVRGPLVSLIVASFDGLKFFFFIWSVVTFIVIIHRWSNIAVVVYSITICLYIMVYLQQPNFVFVVYNNQHWIRLSVLVVMLFLRVFKYFRKFYSYNDEGEWVMRDCLCHISDEITHPFRNFNCATVNIWEFIPHFTGHVITYPCLKLIHVNPLRPSDAYIICVSIIITIGSDNGLSPGRHQAII